MRHEEREDHVEEEADLDGMDRPVARDPVDDPRRPQDAQDANQRQELEDRRLHLARLGRHRGGGVPGEGRHQVAEEPAPDVVPQDLGSTSGAERSKRFREALSVSLLRVSPGGPRLSEGSRAHTSQGSHLGVIISPQGLSNGECFFLESSVIARHSRVGR